MDSLDKQKQALTKTELLLLEKREELRRRNERFNKQSNNGVIFNKEDCQKISKRISLQY